MFEATCDQCTAQQLFGFRHLVDFENEAPGVMALTWSCPGCRSINVTRVGRAVSSAAATAPSRQPTVMSMT